MARVAYFDCFFGCSGDMIIGSLLDAGLDLDFLKKGLAGLDLGGYWLTAEKVIRSSITATKFNVVIEEEHEHSHNHATHRNRSLTEILDIICNGQIPENVKTKSSEMFRKLGEVEARIHSIPADKIQFHELGAVDTIIDIVATVLALETLKIERVYSSPLATGSGTVKTAHGVLPVPAPATLQILADAGVPLVDAPASEKPPGELLTPTGALLIVSLVAGYKRPNMKVERVGYGAGNKQFATWPNVVRVWIGEETKEDENAEMVLLEANIDDMNPQIYGYLMEKLLAIKAADVWFTPIQMKKNRPAIMLSVLGTIENEAKLVEVIMRETSTLGVRARHVTRHTAHREILEFTSSLGLTHVKIKRFGDFFSVSPEYEDCRRIALENGLPLQEVLRIVENEARRNLA